MKKFPIIFKREFLETVKSKAFKAITFIFGAILLVLAAAVVYLSMSSGSDNTVPDASGAVAAEAAAPCVAVVDLTSDGIGEKLIAAIGGEGIQPADASEYERLLEEEEYAAIAVISAFSEGQHRLQVYEKSSLSVGTVGQGIFDSLVQIDMTEKFNALGLTTEQVNGVLSSSNIVYEVVPVGSFAIGNYIVSYGMMILMFLCIMLYGQLVANNVATEKSSRAMEVLITSASPKELLLGKVLGTGAATMLQMTAFVCCTGALAGAATSFSPVVKSIVDGILTIGVSDAVSMVLYFILGFLFITFIYGALGSLVSRLEDVGSLMSLPTMIFMVGYFIAIMVFAAGEVGTLAKVASFIPLWSPMVMMVRMSLESVPFIQLLISLLIQALACVLAGWFAVKLYRRGTLMYGQAPKMTDVFRIMKNK